MIIDADGINSIAGNIDVLKERTGDTILTPHPLEFSRITGLSVAQIQSDRLNAAKGFAQEYGVTLLLKGADTVIAAPMIRNVFPGPSACRIFLLIGARKNPHNPFAVTTTPDANPVLPGNHF